MQYLKGLVAESYKELIFCATVCIVPVVAQFILSNIVSSTVGANVSNSIEPDMKLEETYGNLGSNFDMLGESEGLFLNLSPKVLGLNHRGFKDSQVVIWEGLMDVLLVLTKLYLLRLFDVNKFEEDIQEGAKRIKKQGHVNPYERDPEKKSHCPEQAIRFGRMAIYFQIYFFLIKISIRVIWYFLGVVSYLFQALVLISEFFI